MARSDLRVRRSGRFPFTLAMLAIALVACGEESSDSATSETTDSAGDVSGDTPDDPGPITSVCCETDSGSVYTTNVLCEDEGGQEAPIASCPELCCDNQNSSYSWIAPAECASGGGIPSHPGHCAEVCCEIDGQEPFLELEGNCAFQGGVEAAPEACEPQGPVCCAFTDGVFAVVEPKECVEGAGVPTDDESCEDVCCALDEGTTQTLLAGECALQGGTVVETAECDAPPVMLCCKTEGAIAWIAEGDCPESDVLPEGLCEQTFCCKVMEGPNVGDAAMSTWPDCIEQGGSVVYDGYCEQTVCCASEDGNGLMPFMDCTFAQLTETADCDPLQEEACCKIMTGAGAGDATLATPTACAEQGGAFVTDDYCAQEICCNTDDGPELMPFVACTFLNLTETAACDATEATGCCKDMENPGLGDAWLATPEECISGGGAPIFEEYCDQEVCCDMGDGPLFMPYSDCTFFAMVATYDASESDTPCTPAEEEQCCKISFGVDTGNVVLATPTQCAELGGIITVEEYCEQLVCCDTDAGMEFVSFLECPFAHVNENNACTPPEEEGCCQIVLGPGTGNVMLATPTECAIALGLPNEMAMCDQLLCCDTETGLQMLPFLQCPFLDVVETGLCPQEEPGCCKISAGPDTGNVVMATPTECEGLEGIMTSLDYCEQPMCCNTDDGPQQVPFLECPFQNLNFEAGACMVCCEADPLPVMTPPSECEAPSVLDDAACEAIICCSNGDGATFEGTASECAAESGTVVDEVLCAPPDELMCCDLGEDFSYIPASECASQTGTEAAPNQCQVCCEYAGGGIGEDPAVFCLAGGGTIVDDALCAPVDDSICCAAGEDFSYVPTSQCTESGGTETTLTECQVCCKNPFGTGPQFVFPEDCADDQIQPDTVCQ